MASARMTAPCFVATRARLAALMLIQSRLVMIVVCLGVNVCKRTDAWSAPIRSCPLRNINSRIAKTARRGSVVERIGGGRKPSIVAILAVSYMTANHRKPTHLMRDPHADAGLVPLSAKRKGEGWRPGVWRGGMGGRMAGETTQRKSSGARWSSSMRRWPSADAYVNCAALSSIRSIDRVCARIRALAASKSLSAPELGAAPDIPCNEKAKHRQRRHSGKCVLSDPIRARPKQTKVRPHPRSSEANKSPFQRFDHPLRPRSSERNEAPFTTNVSEILAPMGESGLRLAAMTRAFRKPVAPVRELRQSLAPMR